MEVLGFAIDGGAHIEENNGSLFVGNESGDSGTQNSFHSAGNEHADGEGGTRVTHGDHSIRLASRGQLEGYAQRRIFLTTKAPTRSIFHLHDVGSVMDVDVGWQTTKEGHFLAENSFVSDQKYMKPSLGSFNSPLDGGTGSVVAPHGIKCDSHDAVRYLGSLGFLDVEDTAAAVGTALHADTVPLLPRTTVFTVDKGRIGVEGVMCTSLVTASLAGLSLWNSHCSLSSLPGPTGALRTRHYG
jgi:hypothetical protein